ncbi:ribosome biogenesis GTP-binding protein YihA/YsxC [Buchnera aphidicola]|uniref:Probable GTP-binding protein EngB n=1 Tax=Buchnera aphidicola (Therioaphis trifolii) TaxID=1241884 RepID=A0A4D6YMA6_9GAMM|nr:ribosome biogenesis GTP-binding protein YihA/YsxC [Buchnera aphidicola]QCI27270.1 ribosome biogenesis GTP-binding protein YsxC [Buchnera aphidicola (Therioaphis trifolii)]
MNLNYNNMTFLTSSTNFKCMHIEQYGIEIALFGYSNCGKSTLINCLGNNKKLSRFSRLPGRTNMINFFKIHEKLRLVDLPGYGYSKIYNNKTKNHTLIFNYLKFRICLKRILLLIDIRRLLRLEDIKILNYAKKKCINITILLTKCDKLKFSNRIKQLNFLKKNILYNFKNINIILISSIKNIGIKNVLDIINCDYHQYV